MEYLDKLIAPLLSTLWGQIILIVVGFVLLVKGADWLIDGASALAARWGVPNMIIGLTVVAFGTSLPEFVVNMVSATKGNTDLALTNILGSNMINVLVILGMTALICPVAAKRGLKDINIWLGLLAALLVLLFATYGPINEIGPYEGIALLAVFIIFLIFIFINSRRKGDSDETPIRDMPIWQSLLFIVIGLLGLMFGGDSIVDGATALAHSLGVGDAIIGLTIVALGTSLPELATSVMAAAKKNTDLALGNVLGSNIFNVFFVLGTSAVITPLPAYDGIALDALVTALGSAMILFCISIDKENKIRWWGGLIMLLTYAVYLTYRLLTL